VLELVELLDPVFGLLLFLQSCLWRRDQVRVKMSDEQVNRATLSGATLRDEEVIPARGAV
jgi:hypothetical protein